MTDLEKVVEALFLQKECDTCGSEIFLITETRTICETFTMSSLENDFKKDTPIYNYEIKCSRCKTILVRQTVVKQTWREYWGKIGAILDERRKWRAKSMERDHSGKKL